jgi:hypothetical protein
LSQLEEVLGTETPLSDAADEVQKALLDICGVPEDTSTNSPRPAPEERWCRDEWAFVVNELTTANATDEQLEQVLPRMLALNRETLGEAPN